MNWYILYGLNNKDKYQNIYNGYNKEHFYTFYLILFIFFRNQGSFTWDYCMVRLLNHSYSEEWDDHLKKRRKSVPCLYETTAHRIFQQLRMPLCFYLHRCSQVWNVIMIWIEKHQNRLSVSQSKDITQQTLKSSLHLHIS